VEAADEANEAPWLEEALEAADSCFSQSRRQVSSLFFLMRPSLLEHTSGCLRLCQSVYLFLLLLSSVCISRLLVSSFFIFFIFWSGES